VDLHDYGNKAPIYGICCKYEQVYVGCGLCRFGLYIGMPLVDLIDAATGWNYTPEETLVTGERIATLRQMFNIREGIDPLHVNLPSRIAQPINAEFKVDHDLLRKQYYKGMGWHPDTGHPIESRLRELGLEQFE
jgi:aldehyde:ferredoxin oxidoreductase